MRSHFAKFLAELELTPDERADASGKAMRVARALAAKYYPEQLFNQNWAQVNGSIGKGTAIRPTSDVDLTFFIPRSEFSRIGGLTGNKQSALLQEVRGVLRDRFWNTEIRGDGPVVKAEFESFSFEVLPVFLCDDGSHLTAHTSDGGSWRHCNPAQELQWLNDVDSRTIGKAIHLIKMLKAWKRTCNVEVKSICLEIVAGVFVDQWQYRDRDLLWYDWMVRDFFAFMLREVSDQGWVRPQGSLIQIPFGDKWQSKAQSAYIRALNACEFEKSDNGFSASLEWRKLFGDQFPLNFAESRLYALTSGR